MSNVLHKFKTVWPLSARQKLWLLLIFPLSGVIRAAVLSLPFRYLRKGLGIPYHNYQLCTLVTETQLNRAREIGRTIPIVDKYTPWESNCMVEAILARILFSFYGIPYVFYMGAYLTKDEKEPMKAHA